MTDITPKSVADFVGPDITDDMRQAFMLLRGVVCMVNDVAHHEWCKRLCYEHEELEKLRIRVAALEAKVEGLKWELHDMKYPRDDHSIVNPCGEGK